jgi:hypothetical protein
LAWRSARNKIYGLDLVGVEFTNVFVDWNTGKALRKNLSRLIVNLAHPSDMMAHPGPCQLERTDA